MSPRRYGDRGGARPTLRYRAWRAVQDCPARFNWRGGKWGRQRHAVSQTVTHQTTCRVRPDAMRRCYGHGSIGERYSSRHREADVASPSFANYDVAGAPRPRAWRTAATRNRVVSVGGVAGSEREVGLACVRRPSPFAVRPPSHQAVVRRVLAMLSPGTSIRVYPRAAAGVRRLERGEIQAMAHSDQAGRW